MNPLEALQSQLTLSSMHPLDVLACLGRYERALETRRAEDWEAFYRILFAGMRRIARSDSDVDARGGEAREKLLLLLEDDLGTTLFDRAELQRLRRDLTEDLITL